jgi:hypothetical protein
MSGRDIRRLVASASVFPDAEKASMLVPRPPESTEGEAVPGSLRARSRTSLGHANPSMTLDVYFGRQVVSADAARVLGRRPGRLLRRSVLQRHSAIKVT